MKLKKRNGIYYVDLRSIGKGRLSTRTGDIVQAREAVKQMLEGINCVNNNDYSLSMVISRALSEHYEPYHPKGIAGHRSVLSLIQNEVGGGHQLIKQIDMGRLLDYRNALHNGGVLKNSTINKRMNYLKKVLALAVTWGWLEQSPIFPAVLPDTGVRHRELSMTEQEVILRSFRRQTSTIWMADLVLFLVETGCRLGEAFNLEIADRHEGLITGQLWLRDTKSGTDRRVPLTKAAKQALRDYGWISHTKRQAQYLWDCERGVLGLTEDAGFVLHCLRHTFASRLVQFGISIATISRWLGHSTTWITERYAKDSDENLLKARDLMDGSL